MNNIIQMIAFRNIKVDKELFPDYGDKFRLNEVSNNFFCREIRVKCRSV